MPPPGRPASRPDRRTARRPLEPSNSATAEPGGASTNTGRPQPDRTPCSCGLTLTAGDEHESVGGGRCTPSERRCGAKGSTRTRAAMPRRRARSPGAGVGAEEENVSVLRKLRERLRRTPRVATRARSLPVCTKQRPSPSHGCGIVRSNRRPTSRCDARSPAPRFRRRRDPRMNVVRPPPGSGPTAQASRGPGVPRPTTGRRTCLRQGSRTASTRPRPRQHAARGPLACGQLERWHRTVGAHQLAAARRPGHPDNVRIAAEEPVLQARRVTAAS